MVEDPLEVRRTDPAPYAWLDDTTRPQGALGVPATVVIGLLLLATGAYGGVVSWRHHDRVAAVVLGLIALAGIYVVRMAVLRLAWRRRHPGVDPTVASTLDEGGPVFAQNPGGLAWRWLLFLLGAVVAVFCAGALVVALQLPGPLGGRLAGVAVFAGFLLGGLALARGLWPLLATATAEDAALGLRPSRWGGAAAAARAWRTVLLLAGVVLVLLGLATELAPLLQGPTPPDAVGPVVLALVGLAVLVLGALLVVSTAHRSVIVHRALRAARHPGGPQQAK